MDQHDPLDLAPGFYGLPRNPYLTFTGPQQSRKPPATGDVQPAFKTYNPQALLNPRGKGAVDDKLVNPDDDASTATPEVHLGMGGMLETMYGVQNRETATQQQKRRSERLDDDEEEEPESKKAKSVFSGAGKGGIISEHLKAERKRLAAEAGAGPAPPVNAITIDDDQDDDVVFVKETVEKGDEEICLGVVEGKANIHCIPNVSTSSTSALGKDHWPRTRIEYRRPPGSNATTSKAIELYDRTDKKIGFLDHPTAAGLCPLIDGKSTRHIRIKMMLDQRKRHPNEKPGMGVSQYCKIYITIYAPRRLAIFIGKWLSQRQLFLNPPVGHVHGREVMNPQVPQNFGSTKPRNDRRPQFSGAVVTRTVEEMRRDAINMMDQLTKHADLAEMEADDRYIATPLLAHQKQALSFMTDHERDDQSGASHSLWKQNKDGRGWYHVVTGDKVDQRPAAVQGGMLADSMGLGKTLSILSLIAATQDVAAAFQESDVDPSLPNTVERCVKTTLIICPKSVMSNWTEQISAHIKHNRFKVYSYHGPSRITDIDTLADYDIILTTYNTVAAECNKAGSPLAALQWFRIVLDEAHQIRNATTLVSKACCALQALRRWAVTGTPIQNKLDDLGALIRFLHIKPFDEISAWNTHFMARFKMADVEAIPHLHLLIDSITLCRGKEKIGLGERKEYTERLQFSDTEKKIYSRVAGESSKQLKIMSGKGLLKGKSYAQVLKALGRLRMICAHGLDMFSEEDRNEISEGLDPDNAIALDLGDEPGGDFEFISEKQAYDTLHMFMESDNNACVRCQAKVGGKDNDLDSDEEEDDDDDDDTIGYLTPCYHLICGNCHTNHEMTVAPLLGHDDHYECPYCQSYNRNGLFHYLQSTFQEYVDAREAKTKNRKGRKWDGTYSGPHTKVKRLLEELQQSAEETAQLPTGSPPIRSIVFSGWTTYLDLIEVALSCANMGFLRLDGTMSIKQRTAVLEQFKTDPAITVMVISIKAGGQGLNLTAASRVYMMEPQFNPGVEQQAVDRVHRLGQTRDVLVKHYIMAGSVEEGIVELQQRKNKLAEMSMERKMSKAEEQQKKLDDLRLLFK